MTTQPSTHNTEEKLQMMREEAAWLEAKVRLMEGLPFKHGYKLYQWQRDFINSTNRMNFVCAANQIGKSTGQIMKAITWATDKTLWERLWPGRTPNMMWYFYPSNKQVESEFETKWQLYLPQNEYKDHPEYGWKTYKHEGVLSRIKFNSGMTIYFKTYSQKKETLQSGTVYAVFADEEMPEDLYDEINMRLAATNGYFHMVFTATLGQELWRKVIEPTDQTEEKFPDAFKRQVSMYDCLQFEDGSPSHWTRDSIALAERTCRSDAEISRRIHGKFVVDSDLKYGTFSWRQHMKEPHPLPDSWHLYSGVDIGSGGDNHKPAIVFVAVRPDYREGRVFLGWKGDDGDTYTAGDVYEKYKEMRGWMPLISCRYDWASKDFHTIATDNGEAVVPADKNHERGEQIVNTLFKNNMLYVYNTDELIKLGQELSTLKNKVDKRKAKDDLCDALRYCVTTIPWDFTVLGEKVKVEGTNPEEENEQKVAREDLRRGERGKWMPQDEAQGEQGWDIASEFEEANDSYGC